MTEQMSAQKTKQKAISILKEAGFFESIKYFFSSIHIGQVEAISSERMLAQNPLRTDFQQHYEEIVAEYNREKDRVTIEKTFEDLLRLTKELDKEEKRAVREGLDMESLAIFDLLKKPELQASEITKIKSIAVDLLVTLKAEKLRIDQWREKEATRDAVKLSIRDFLYGDERACL